QNTNNNNNNEHTKVELAELGLVAKFLFAALVISSSRSITKFSPFAMRAQQRNGCKSKVPKLKLLVALGFVYAHPVRFYFAIFYTALVFVGCYCTFLFTNDGVLH
ncbi:unnamed protein product, partial [Ceratitis capitata]